MTVDKLRLLLEDLIKNDEPDTYNELEEKAYISYISEMSAHERHKLTIDLLEDLKAYDSYFDLVPLTDNIDKYLNGKIKYSDLKFDIPELKPLNFYEPQIEEIKENFEQKLYSLVLREKFIGRRDVFSNIGVIEVFNEILNRKIEGFKDSVCVPKEIIDIIENIDKTCGNNKYKYVNDELLSLLFLYENGIKYKPSLDLENLLKLDLEKKELVEDIALNEKKMKKLKRKISLYNVATYLYMMGVGILLVHGMFLLAKKDKSKVTINNEKTIEHNKSFIFMHDVRASEGDKWLKDLIKENAKKDVIRSYITEFGEVDADGKVNVKVYDYTGVEVSMDEIDTMVLDEERLVVNKTYGRSSYYKDYFGEDTGKAHRDFSTIDFKTGYSTFTNILKFMIIFLYNFEVFASIEEEKQKNEKYKEYLEIEKLTKDDTKRLEEILLKIKALQEKDLIATKLDTIREDTIDKKLEENKPIGFKI